MMNKWILLTGLAALLLGGFGWMKISQKAEIETSTQEPVKPIEAVSPLSIEVMRSRTYPGSTLTLEETLAPGSNFNRMIVSYDSDGLKQYGLLTVPNKAAPLGGWPAIVFNHGYIQPNEYRTTERYVAYVEALARAGYVVLKPDYRGHDKSEGVATGGYGTPDYTIDVLNGLASLKQYPGVNADKVGMWGHSMGGHITVRAMVVDPSIKAGVIWGGVVGSYQDYQELWWSRRNRPTPDLSQVPERGRWRTELTKMYGNFESNPTFWNSISATYYLTDLGGPIQLHQALGDETVPYQLSERFAAEMKAANQEVELYEYPGDNHNISGHFSEAMARTIAFFDKHLKGI